MNNFETEDNVNSADQLVVGSVSLPLLVAGHEPYKLFVEGDELYDAMLASMQSATQSIRLESYIFAEDEIGRRFAEVMIEKVSAGVDVRLHIDAAGSFFWTSGKIEKYLKKNRVMVRWFHRWSWRLPFRYNQRNHRKLLVVDEKEVYLGGFNIHRENSRKIVGDKRWRDTHVRVSDGLAREAAVLFDIFWEGKRRWSARKTSCVNMLVPNHTIPWRRALHQLYAEGIRGAEKSVYLTTPYFVPDFRLQQELVAAARRGIDVKILLPRKSDIWLTKWAAWAAYAPLLDAGVRIYEYLPRVLHAKTVVVDGSWAMLGTANFDYRSFFVNYELNMLSKDSGLSRDLQQQFIQDLENAEEIAEKKWSKRPLILHFAELIGWFARRWL